MSTRVGVTLFIPGTLTENRGCAASQALGGAGGWTRMLPAEPRVVTRF